jgi:translation initiation factor IF-2
MQQRRPRLGDVIDDYCPRERRITNHAVVAMIEDDVKQTRCTTCDAEHEYKQARVPATRRRKTAVAAAHLVDAPSRLPEAGEPHDDEVASLEEAPQAAESAPESGEPLEAGDALEPVEPLEPVAAAEPDEPLEPEDDRDEWPVHRPLIRAQLPRPEGHTPERKEPDFTMRQGGRFDQNRNNGQRHRGGHGRVRHAQGGGQGNARFGGQRGPGFGQGGGHGQRQGNRAGQGGGNRAGQGQGQGRGPRPGGGRKRGR